METSMMTRKKCNKCNKGDLDTRAKRGVFVKMFLFWLPIKRYKCNYCNKKTYLLGSSLQQFHESRFQTS